MRVIDHRVSIFRAISGCFRDNRTARIRRQIFALLEDRVFSNGRGAWFGSLMVFVPGAVA
jgi:hypothetical protein